VLRPPYENGKPIRPSRYRVVASAGVSWRTRRDDDVFEPKPRLAV
jgi:hypothetical protein